MKLERYRRVLSLNLHGLGDFITTLPVLSELAARAAETVTCLVWPAFEDFARSVPFIGRVVALPKDRENEPELSPFIRELAGPQGFDLVLDFSFLPRSGVITKAAGGKLTLGFGAEFRDFPWYAEIVPNVPGEHRLQRNYHFFELLGLEKPMKPDFRIEIPPQTVERVENLLSVHGIDLSRERPVALHPGSGAARRNWPAERFAGLADRIADHSGKTVILLGGRQRAYDGTDETALAAEVQNRMQSAALNLAGRLSLPELAALLSRASLFVGNNSGPAHLAASVAGVDSLLVWAPRNEKVWRPVGAKVELVYAETFCSDGCLLNACPNMQYCLERLTVDEVFVRYLEVFGNREAVLRAAGDSG